MWALDQWYVPARSEEQPVAVAQMREWVHMVEGMWIKMPASRLVAYGRALLRCSSFQQVAWSRDLPPPSNRRLSAKGPQPPASLEDLVLHLIDVGLTSPTSMSRRTFRRSSGVSYSCGR